MLTSRNPNYKQIRSKCRFIKIAVCWKIGMASRKYKKQRRRENRRIFEEFERARAARAVIGGSEVVVRSGHEQFKMADVLFDFIEPYAEGARSDDDFRSLVMTGKLCHSQRMAGEAFSGRMNCGWTRWSPILCLIIESAIAAFWRSKRACWQN